MVTPDSDQSASHWLDVHDRLRTQVRRMVGLLALLAAISVVQGFGRLQRLNRDYQYARAFTLQLRDSGPRPEASELFFERCIELGPACDPKGKIAVWLEEIPEVSWEFEQYLETKRASGWFKVFGYDLGYAAFVLFFALAPLVLQGGIYLRLRTTKTIAGFLRPRAAERGEVQQRLNSVFSDRATVRLGERRWLHTAAWTTGATIFAATPIVFLLTMHVMRSLNTRVTVDASGRISVLPVADLAHRTVIVTPGDSLLAGVALLLLATLVIGVLSARVLLQQLTPVPAVDDPEEKP